MATNINLADLDRLAQNPKVQVDDSYDGFLNNAAFLEFNVEHPILAKPEVRGPIEAGGATVYPPMTPKQVNDFYLKDAHEIEVVAKGMGFTKQ